MTKQEMFDKAVRGLAGQGWKRATATAMPGRCVYYAPDTKYKCAWGHVDDSLEALIKRGRKLAMDVIALAGNGIGLAAVLGATELDFARNLQNAHDMWCDQTLEGSFRRLAREYGLTWPSDINPAASAT